MSEEEAEASGTLSGCDVQGMDAMQPKGLLEVVVAGQRAEALNGLIGACHE